MWLQLSDIWLPAPHSIFKGHVTLSADASLLLQLAVAGSCQHQKADS